jgi:hypothetical protein
MVFPGWTRQRLCIFTFDPHGFDGFAAGRNSIYAFLQLIRMILYGFTGLNEAASMHFSHDPHDFAWCCLTGRSRIYAFLHMSRMVLRCFDTLDGTESTHIYI